MTLDEIIAAFRIESASNALTAGVAHAAELAPIAYAIADRREIGMAASFSPNGTISVLS